ncbi:iron-sulfur cluster assembly scaffold protein [Balneolaceae bacterium ANBcel3]|nr:iron-sulfur cluster assembly scaffold protein [Balneolaceae bacterium ANBcel3]
MNQGTKNLLKHYKFPFNHTVPAQKNVSFTAVNRACGDQIALYAVVEQHTLKELFFQGKGCLYCIASASVLCQHMKNKELQEAQEEVKNVREWLLESDGKPPEGVSEEILALGEIKTYPTRIPCADLAWKGLEELLKKYFLTEK